MRSDGDRADADLEQIAERTREILGEKVLDPSETKALLEDFLVSLDGDPERLRKELEKLAWDAEELVRRLEERKE